MAISGIKSRLMHQSKIWLHFLENINDEPENREKIMDYLFDQFRESPDAFLKFILFFKKTLRATKDPKRRKILAKRYLDILTFFCERYSLFEIKGELDDYCFRITSPARYHELNSIVVNYKKKSDKVISEVIKKFYTLLKENGFKFEINGRYKNIYSIHRKLQRASHADVLSLRDIFAFRVITKNDSIADCFKILDLFHDNFKPVAVHFKDYISIPKINGYQSLHISLMDVIPNLGVLVEVQIRTKTMHETAEKGFASHWLYSKTKKSEVINEKSKKLIDYLIAAPVEEDHSPINFLAYSGDIFSMPKGSTALDFAYNIHTEFGHYAKSAIVNGVSEGLNYKLKEGDIVKIRKSNKREACKEWLDYANNKYTLSKIHEAIRD